MEKAIYFDATEDTPKVVLDKEKMKFEISGRSLPEDAEKFYETALNWMRNYANEPSSFTDFNINLEYFNSGSVKQVLKILITLEKVVKNGGKVSITWFYNQDDELMEIKGQEIKSILKIPFHLKIIE
ncbi:MAG: DUF1987 domain-containing protein [Bacteroidetes bacterium]|nr:DUF1987 domain-containing protein [Bacteroidota bacterium]HET6243050.1 DUF1987 domain-containing protein [Bacteroidia bacterium]